MRGTSFSSRTPSFPRLEALRTDMGSSPSLWAQHVLMSASLLLLSLTLYPSSLPDCLLCRPQAPSYDAKMIALQTVICSSNCTRLNPCNKSLMKYIFLLLVLLLWSNPDGYKCLLCARYRYKPTAYNSFNLHDDPMT